MVALPNCWAQPHVSARSSWIDMLPIVYQWQLMLSQDWYLSATTAQLSCDSQHPPSVRILSDNTCIVCFWGGSFWSICHFVQICMTNDDTMVWAMTKTWHIKTICKPQAPPRMANTSYTAQSKEQHNNEAFWSGRRNMDGHPSLCGARTRSWGTDSRTLPRHLRLLRHRIS